MQDSFNPYAAPTTLEMHPAASEWLGTPNESLRKVASGLGLIRNGLILLILGVLLYVVGMAFVVFGGAGRDALQLLTVLFEGMVFVGQIMNLLGSIRCLSTPPETRARGWIVASVVAEVLSMILGMDQLVGAKSEAAQSAQQLVGIVAFVTFILFLRQLGLFIGRTDLARRAINLLILWGVLIGLSLALIASAFLLQQRNGRQMFGAAGMGPEIAIVCGVTVLVLSIMALAKYLSLLADMKSAILNGR